MDKMGEEAAAKFINALIKSVQTLCHGYLDFQTGIEIIGHINLSVDKGTSLDYILKEKVCKNAENSTLFISNSFHAEPKSEQEVPGKNSQTGNQNVQNRQSADSGETGRLSAISSISSALSASRERSRQSSTKDSDSSQPHQSTAKRKASDDSGSEIRPSKVSSHHDSISRTSSDSAFPPTSSSPVDSKLALRGLRTSDAEMSETMLPQTANVTSDNAADIGVNLAGSVLEPVDDQSNTDLPERDDDSDGDLEVTFIKEEYVEGERSACEYENSGQQFVGGPQQRASEGMPDPSLYPVALHGSSSASATYVPSTHDQQFPPGGMGPSTSHPQPGPSGMRGLSGVQSFVNSLSAFGSLGAPGLPLAQTHGLADHCTQNPVMPRAPGSHLSFPCPKPGYSSSHLALQRAFALYRDDKRKKHFGRKEEELKTKERLELMSAGYRQLLEQKGAITADCYKRAIEREKRRLAKKAYRATLSETKKTEIKEKDKERKRMRRAARAAAAVDVSNIMQQFSLGFPDSIAGLGSHSVAGVSGLGHPAGGSLPHLDASCDDNIRGPSIISNLSEVGSGLADNASDTNSSSVENSSWIDSVSFDTCAQEPEEEESDQKSKINNEQSTAD